MAYDRINDRYNLERRLGAGGMGDVWLASDDLLGRSVAIKFVGERELRETPGAEEILRDEARHAGRLLGNSQVVAVLDLIDVDTDMHKGPAVVLEYVRGCTVGEWIAVHRDQLDDFTRSQTGFYIIAQITEALLSAHKLHILHRDVKPQNVLCSVTGHVKVADFGLSEWLRRSRVPTPSGGGIRRFTPRRSSGKERSRRRNQTFINSAQPHITSLLACLLTRARRCLAYCGGTRPAH
jgi:serine/threonine-protein kinase